jgi:uncharacterized protein (TIGR02145 family)
MMKIHTTTLVLAILACLLVKVFAQPFEGEKGDVNNDGTINVLDIVSVVNHILGVVVLDEQGISRADCNGSMGSCEGDGVIDIMDALKIVNVILQNDACDNTKPTASFTVNPLSGMIDTLFNVDASGSSDNEDSTSSLKVRWDWEDDGAFDTDWSTDKTASHTYSNAGAKIIKLEVRDSGGLTDRSTRQVMVFPPGCGTMIDIDGNEYHTVQIGDQCWMFENLKVTHYRNGDAIPNVTNFADWGNLSTGAYSSYGNDAKNGAIYGLLYNWAAVNDSRNIAPIGWHVPTDEEWKELEMSLGMSQSEADDTEWRGTDEGGKMKEAGTSHWYSPNTGATNSSGFTALPGGYRRLNGAFDLLGYITSFWSSSGGPSNSAWFRHLNYPNSDIYRDYANKKVGYSVRCLRD